MLAQVSARGFVLCFSLFRSSESFMRRIRRNMSFFPLLKIVFCQIFFFFFKLRINDGYSGTIWLAALTMQNRSSCTY